MRMVRIYKENDSILACAVDLEYYKGLGWSDKAPAKKAKSKPEEGVS